MASLDHPKTEEVNFLKMEYGNFPRAEKLNLLENWNVDIPERSIKFARN